MKKHPAPRLGTNGDVIGQRVLAFFVDSILLGLVWGAFAGLGILLGEMVGTLLVLVGFAMTIVYGFLLEGMYGYTPGKYLLGLVVVKSNGSNCTIGASILRNLLWVIDSLPTFNLIAVVMILLTDKNQRVGDFVADTVVVEQR